jgi:hypothetical protein
MPAAATTTTDLAEENARLSARVRELEHLLELERARNVGLERGLSAMSERVMTLRHPSSLETTASNSPGARTRVAH